MPVTRLEVLRVLGARGDPGRFLCGGGFFTEPPPGSRFEWTQETPATVWTVPHNLGCRPCVVVTDETGSQVFADVQYVSDDIVRVTHGRALAGAVCCV